MRRWGTILLGLAACGDARDEQAVSGGGATSGVETDAEPPEDEDDGEARLDLGDGPGGMTGGDGEPSCKVEQGLDGVGDCTEQAPPDSFEPEVQWTWTAPAPEKYVLGLPVVGNLTDDNGDGAIDLCDVPDIVVIAFDRFEQLAWVPGHIYVLDGATGQAHFDIDFHVQPYQAPAIGDIDGDGVMEIVAITWPGPNDSYPWGTVAAFENDGTLKWIGEATTDTFGETHAIGLADIDNDGDVEIYGGGVVWDHEGKVVFRGIGSPLVMSSTTAADLDGDEDLEIITGINAYQHDGSLYYHYEMGFDPQEMPASHPAVANLDDDEDPEILLTGDKGIALLEHDGTVIYRDMRPNGDPDGGNNWLRPAVIHDFDGDGEAEYALSSADHYTVFERDASVLWSVVVDDMSGSAAGTAFDFLGDGIAEAIYADEYQLFVYDGVGDVLVSEDRYSRTGIEFPVVADVDNDGSAEIVVVSNETILGEFDNAPSVKVIRDKQDRWIPARRIWNQHTYHVTNVLEDGTIPKFEQPHWKQLNTFRTNAQIENGGTCMPVPEG